jgi:hypothetical protein
MSENVQGSTARPVTLVEAVAINDFYDGDRQMSDLKIEPSGLVYALYPSLR